MFHNHLGSLLAAGSVAAIVLATPAAGQVGDEQFYALPAQDLATSLREVATRSGRNIIAPSELVSGRQAPAVSGPFTAEGAVRLLLTGSGLDVRRVGDSLVIFRQNAGEERAGAEPAAEEEAIIVTGTNLRGGTPTSPPIVITRRDIEQTGATAVEQLMRQVPQNSGAGIGQENFAIPGAGPDITEHGAGVNLRGLGQRATLVLLNGRRLAPSGAGSFADISLIPLSAVERVEILPDGASAIYGSDAVGGVVNFLLRRRFEGVEASLTAGTATQGDGDVLAAGLTAGHSWASGNALLAYEYRRADEISARDRDYVINLPPDWSLAPAERRHSLFGAFSQDLGDAVRLELTGFFADRDTRRSYFLSTTSIPVDAQAEAQSLGGTVALVYDFAAGWSAELSGSYARSETDQRQNQAGGQGLINRLASLHDVFDLRLKLDGTLLNLPGGAVRTAVGAEQRRETYWSLFEAGSLQPNVKTSDRDVTALFAEVNIPLFSELNRRPGIERLIVSAAGRFEHYDQFGSTFNPKIGLHWDPVPWLTLRTSYDTSFRAPLLSESTGYYNAFLFPAALFYTNPAAAPQAVGLALVGSNPEIGPERSRSWTAGLALRPLGGLELSATYYAIRFSDRIGVPTPLLNVVGDPARASVVTLDPAVETTAALLGSAGQVLDFTGPGFTNGGATPADVRVIVDARTTNTAVTVTDGLDLAMRYAFEAGPSRFSVDLAGTIIFNFDEQLSATSPIDSILSTPYRPNGLRLRGAFSWTLAPFSLGMIANHVGAYTDDRTAVERPAGSFTTFDVSAAYELGGGRTPGMPDLRLGLVIENLFDEEPPRLVPDPGALRGLGYDPVNASARGRAVSLQLRARW